MAIITGTSGNDTLSAQATASADTVNAGSGNDIMAGGGGADVFNAGNGDDRIDVTAVGDVVAGESFNGGLGWDAINLTAAGAVDLSVATINSDVEQLNATGAVTLTAAQLGQFRHLQTGAITINTSGAIVLSNAVVGTEVFNLSALGNSLNLSGLSNAGYTVNGGNAADVITGGDGRDILNGGGGNDTIAGGAGDDTITGGAGFDALSGGDGNDQFIVLAQSDAGDGESVTGGLGRDELFLNNAGTINISAINIGADVEALTSTGSVQATAAQLSAFKSVNASSVTVSTTGAVTFAGDKVQSGIFGLHASGNIITFAGATAGFYTVNGGSGNDTITGGDRSQGGDILNGGGGNDTINGGIGDDVMNGGAGVDTMNGGNGNDTFLITSAADVVAAELYNGGQGLDTIEINSAAAVNMSAATINASTERLISNADVTLTATQAAGLRLLDTGDKSVTIGTTGTVSFVGDTVLTQIFNLNVGGNSISFSGVRTSGYIVNGNNGVDSITGGDKDDQLLGGGGNDNLTGGAGDDILIGGAGKDSHSAGAGNDIIRVLAATDIVAAETYAGGTGYDVLEYHGTTNASFAGVTISTDVESFITSDYDAEITFTATQLGNLEYLDTGVIRISNTGTANLSDAEVWTSEFYLNAGGNSFTLTGALQQGYTVYGGAGIDTINGGDFEDGEGDVLYGAGGNDKLTGNAGNDLLIGGAGADTQSGGVGNDIFRIDSASEVATGLSGTTVVRETFNGDDGWDEILVNTSALVDLSITTIAADVEVLRAESTLGLTLSAAQLDKFAEIRVDGAINVNTIGVINFADSEIDDVTFNLFSGGNTIDFLGVSSGQYSVNGGAAADTINGGDHNDGDTLHGGGASDTISGKGGDDIINGGAGADLMNGDEGDDTFVFNVAAEIVAGDTVNGGAGFDTISIETATATNITAITVGADVEGLTSSVALTATAAQIDRFT